MARVPEQSKNTKRYKKAMLNQSAHPMGTLGTKSASSPIALIAPPSILSVYHYMGSGHHGRRRGSSEHMQCIS